MAALTPDHFELHAEPPMVTLSAKETKNKKKAIRQPLPEVIAAEFREYLQGRAAKSAVWPGTWHEKPAKMLKLDLEDAGIPYVIATRDGNKYLDAHSLRHTYVTSLASAGVGPKELQELARHADIKTTLSVYTHTNTTALVNSVARLIVPGAVDRAPTLATMPRPQLEQLAAVAITLVNTLVASHAQIPAQHHDSNRDKPGLIR